MKLFPAIVTLHLLGGYVLLALLTAQGVLLAQQQGVQSVSVVSPRLRLAVGLALALLVLQATSGAWVSTNYAVLACTEFPSCQGSWWPQMDFAHGFEIWRPLGYGKDGEHISFQSLTAIHYTHRLMAFVTLALLAALVMYLRREPTLHKQSRDLAGLLLLQLATGMSNVVLDWPLVAAVLHTGGAGAMVVVLVWALVSTRSQPVSAVAPAGLRA
jgi:cytochrome c oxidase assembly protein subunit 15